MEADFRRVVVVGPRSAGKSWLSRRLAEKLGAPCVHLDGLAWVPAWTRRPRAEFRGMVAQAVAGSRWIVDGDYPDVRDLVWARATTIVWLDLPFRVVLRRALGRARRRTPRKEKLFPDAGIRFVPRVRARLHELRKAVTTFRLLRRQFAGLRDERYLHLRAPREVEALLDEAR